MSYEVPKLETLHSPNCSAVNWSRSEPCDCAGGRLTAALQFVIDLHRPDHLGCNECGEQRRLWPCPTLQGVVERLKDTT